MEEQKKSNQLNIELSEEVGQGVYSNLAIITHSTSEFVIDFVRILPGLPKAGVKSRIILTPEHAKRLLMALQDKEQNIEITKQQPVQLFPNPTNGPLNIILPQEQSFNYQILTLDGKSIESKNLKKQNSIHLSLDGLDNGIYIFRLYSNTKCSYFRIIKI